MTYAGTAVITKIAKNVLKITVPDLDADSEYAVIDLRTYKMEGAQDFTMQVQRTVGATDVVAVHLKASNDGVNFVAIITETSHEGWSAVVGKACQQIQVLVTTVGAGNTLTAHLYATING